MNKIIQQEYYIKRKENKMKIPLEILEKYTDLLNMKTIGFANLMNNPITFIIAIITAIIITMTLVSFLFAKISLRTTNIILIITLIGYPIASIMINEPQFTIKKKISQAEISIIEKKYPELKEADEIIITKVDGQYDYEIKYKNKIKEIRKIKKGHTLESWKEYEKDERDRE